MLWKLGWTDFCENVWIWGFFLPFSLAAIVLVCTRTIPISMKCYRIGQKPQNSVLLDFNREVVDPNLMKDIVLQSHFSMKNQTGQNTSPESNSKIATTTPSSMTNFNTLSHFFIQLVWKRKCKLVEKQMCNIVLNCARIIPISNKCYGIGQRP